MADYRKRLAERLEHERTKKSLSHESLADKSGVSSKTIKRIEARKVDNPRPVTIRRLADALQIPPTKLRPPTELEGEQLDHIEAKLDALLEWAETGEIEQSADRPLEPGEEEAGEAGQ